MGEDTGPLYVLSQCIHYPSGNNIIFTKKTQVLKLTSDGTVSIGGNVDRIGALDKISIKDIQNIKFALHKARRPFVDDIKISMLAIFGYFTALISLVGAMASPVATPLLVSPLFGIFLIAQMNKILSSLDPAQTLTIQTNDTELNIYNKGYWSGYYRRLSFLMMLFYPMLIVLWLIDGLSGGSLGVEFITGMASLPSIMCTFYIFIYEIINRKHGNHMKDFERFCYIIRSQHLLLKDHSIAEAKRDLHPEFNMLKQLFDKHQAELQSIKIEIETLSLNPAASVSIQQIGIATERMLMLACETEGGKPGKPPTLCNYIQWLGKNVLHFNHVYESSQIILAYRNFVMHGQPKQSEIVLPVLLQNFNQILEWYTNNYLVSEQN